MPRLTDLFVPFSLSFIFSTRLVTYSLIISAIASHIAIAVPPSDTDNFLYIFVFYGFIFVIFLLHFMVLLLIYIFLYFMVLFLIHFLYILRFIYGPLNGRTVYFTGRK